MVSVYDMLAGAWTEDEGEDDGPGRGGCCRPDPAPRAAQTAVPRLALRLVEVAEEVARCGRGLGGR